MCFGTFNPDSAKEQKDLALLCHEDNDKTRVLQFLSSVPTPQNVDSGGFFIRHRTQTAVRQGQKLLSAKSSQKPESAILHPTGLMDEFVERIKKLLEDFDPSVTVVERLPPEPEDEEEAPDLSKS